MSFWRKTLGRVLGWGMCGLLAAVGAAGDGLTAGAQVSGVGAGPAAGAAGGGKAGAPGSGAPGSGAPGAGAPGAGAGIFPLAEVRRGLKGEAWTVFEGVDPERMEVEILGVLRDALGPGRDMILARLRGSKPEYTGVVAGMSGSPVYVDGRLVGALSYRIGQFSKDPIAGITPIEEMFEVRDTPVVGVAAVAGVAGGGAGVGGVAGVKSAAGMEMEAIETPLGFGGFSQEAVERFGEGFRRLGMTPVAGLGGRDRTARQTEPLVPGSAVSAVLVDGDLSITGTCTVTYIDRDRLLACGHPMMQSGPVEMPMTKAEVVATLASPLNAFKIINATEVVGAFTEDRASAISGRLGATARMIPVSVEVVPEGAGSGVKAAHTYHFGVVNNRELTPQAMMVSIFQTLQDTNAAAAETSYKVTGEIRLELPAAVGGGGTAAVDPVHLEGVVTPGSFSSGAMGTAFFVGERFNRLFGNQREQPRVTEVRLRVGVVGERRSAEIVAARVNPEEARAGETVEVEVTVNPFHAAQEVLRIPVRLPDSLASGPLRMLVSDGGTLDRLRSMHDGTQGHAAGLLDAVKQVNGMHPNDRVYVTVLDHNAQAVLPSGTLESVPLSMANVLEPGGETQRLQLTGESVAEVGSVGTEFAVSGFQVLDVAVR